MPEAKRTMNIKARPSAVWKWFESQNALRRWLRPDLEIDLQVGGAYSMTGSDEETTITGTMLELIPEGGIILSWFEENQGWKHPARLVLKLEPTETGTQVTLFHDGLAGIGNDDWERTLGAYERGADKHKVLEGLAALVEAGD